MPIVEEGSNFPSALGLKNRPRTEVRTGPIAGRAMALVGGETPIHLAQKVGGLGLREKLRMRTRRGTMPSSLSVESEFETEVHNAQYRHQLTKYPVIPLLDRPHPIADVIKAWAPIVPRTKMLGAFGVVDPTEPGISIDSYEKNIPRPYPRPMGWDIGKNIANLPSAIAFGPGAGGPSGPSRTVHPSISIEL